MNPKQFESRYKAIIEHCKMMQDECELLWVRQAIPEQYIRPIECLIRERNKERALKVLIKITDNALLDSKHHPVDSKLRSNLVYLASYCASTANWLINS